MSADVGTAATQALDDCLGEGQGVQTGSRDPEVVDQDKLRSARLLSIQGLLVSILLLQETHERLH